MKEWSDITRNAKGHIATKLIEKLSSELRHDNIVLFWDNYYEQIDIIETFSRLQYCIVRDSFISKEINVLSAVLQADNAACNNT